MENMDILLGFDDPKMESVIYTQLLERGIKANFLIKLSKASIKEYLHMNSSCNTAILLENLNPERKDDTARFSAEELAQLKEN